MRILEIEKNIDKEVMRMIGYKKMAGATLMAVALMMVMATALLAKDVTVVAEGASKQEAMNNAARAGVEQALGVLIDSKTQVKDYQVLVDRIVASSAGYVRAIQPLAEGKDPISGLYKIKAVVTVDDNKLGGALTEFMNDPRAKKVFQEVKFDNKRVLVLYTTNDPDDLPYKSKPADTLLRLIEDKLVGHAFRVFLPDELIRIRGKQFANLADQKTGMELAQQENADALVIVTLNAVKGQAEDGFNRLTTEISMRAFDPTTGELWCNIIKEDKVAVGGKGMTEAVRQVVAKAGPQSADELAGKIVQRFSEVRQKFAYLVFRNMPVADQDKTEDMIEDIGWKSKTVKQVRDYLELEIFCDADLNTIKRQLRRGLAKASLPYENVETIGARIIFDRKK